MLVCSVMFGDIFLLIVLIAFKKIPKSRGECANNGTISINECCSNHHLVNGICEACPAGFFGRNCSVRCPPPTYGLYCGSSCNCSSSECNHIHGCWHTACPAGFFGGNCSVRCPPPTYGLFCWGSCNCSSSQCNHILGCLHYETTTYIAPTLEYNTTFLSKPATKDIQTELPWTTFLSKSVTKYSQTEIPSYQRTIHDDKFIVILSVTVVSSVIIVLVLIITKLRCNTNINVIYYSQDTRRQRPLSMHDQVPFGNLETDVYMEVEEMDEMQEISNRSFEKLESNIIGAVSGTNLDSLSKPKPNSLLRVKEKSLSKTNLHNTLKPKPDSFKQETNSVKKLEKYRTLTTRRLLYSRMCMKRYNSWHNVKDLPDIQNSFKKTNSDLNIFTARLEL